MNKLKFPCNVDFRTSDDVITFYCKNYRDKVLIERALKEHEKTKKEMKNE